MPCPRTLWSVAVTRVVLGLVAATALSTSVSADDAKKYADEKFLFSLTVPQPWAEAALANYAVPGTVRAAWAGQDMPSLLAFVQEPGTALSPRFLVDESAKAMREKLGCEITSSDVKTVGGKKAMWLVATGKGTGGALTGQGDVDTTTHWVAVPREKDIVVFLLTCPATDYKKLLPSFEEAIKSAKIEGKQTAEQAEAK
jgi:hypothetical protein